MNSLSCKAWRILIADDNPDDRAELRHLLFNASEARYTFTEVGSGRAAIDTALTMPGGPPDMLLLDYYMRDMLAPEVLAALKGTNGMTICPVVVMTGATDAELGQLVLRAGADDFIGKSWLSAPGLMRSIENAAERWTMRCELIEQAYILTTRERELRTITDNTPDMIGRFDRTLRHVFVNAAVEKVTGKPPTYYLGRTHREANLPESLCEQWESALTQVFQTGQAQMFEFSFGTPYGNQEFASRLIPEVDHAGTVVFVLAVTHDITERKKMETVLRENDQRKDEFLATLSHELRNPMAVLSSGLEILRQAPAGAAAAMEARDMMERQFRHMERFVDDLLDISRVNSGKLMSTYSLLALQEVFDHAIEASNPGMIAAGHVLTVETGTMPILVHGDLTRLAQVFSNLLNNAAKYTPRGGNIVLSATVEQQQAVIRVTDNGVGIPANMLAKVFDLFTQVRGTRANAQGGLGIGLSLAEKLLEMHGGSIVCDSPGLDMGSTFTVRLPLASEPSMRVPVLPGAAAPTSTSTPAPTSTSAQLDPTLADTTLHKPIRRVLVIDDNVDVARTLSLMLRFDGHETQMVHDGKTALAMMADFRPAVIFLDISMPVMDGYEVARRIRADPRMNGVMLVALTGWDSTEDQRRARECGFDHYLTKPVGPAVLAALLRADI